MHARPDRGRPGRTTAGVPEIPVAANSCHQQVFSARFRPFDSTTEAARLLGTGQYGPGQLFEQAGYAVISYQTSCGILEFCVWRPDVLLMLHYFNRLADGSEGARLARPGVSCGRPAERRCNYNGCMSVSLTIRDLPEATRDMLRQRAEARRQSLNSYIVDLLEREAGLPTMSEWADMVETRARLAGSSDAAVEAVRELRDAV